MEGLAIRGEWGIRLVKGERFDPSTKTCLLRFQDRLKKSWMINRRRREPQRRRRDERTGGLGISLQTGRRIKLKPSQDEVSSQDSQIPFNELSIRPEDKEVSNGGVGGQVIGLSRGGERDGSFAIAVSSRSASVVGTGTGGGG